MPIEYTNDMAVNVAKIDDQHRDLVQLANKLEEAVVTNADYKQIDAIIDQLSAFAHTHFELEEGYMKRYKYPSADAHILNHKTMFIQSVALAAELMESDAPPMDLLQTFQSWIAKHINDSDKALGEYLNGKGIY